MPRPGRRGAALDRRCLERDWPRLGLPEVHFDRVSTSIIGPEPVRHPFPNSSAHSRATIATSLAGPRTAAEAAARRVHGAHRVLDRDALLARRRDVAVGAAEASAG